MMNELKITVPELWDDVNIKTFQKFSKLNLEEMTEMDIMLNTVHIFCGIDLKTINKIAYNDLLEIFNQVASIINNESDIPLQEIVKIDGIEYGFHPSLKDITTGEFADLEHYLTGGAWKNMHKILAVLYRPVKVKYQNTYSIEEYDVNSFEKRAELFREKLMLDAVLGASVFFSDLGSELLNHFLHYSEAQLKQMKGENFKAQVN